MNDYFYEMEGPPRAYFELRHPSDDPRLSSFCFRIVYETVCVFGPTKEACEEKFAEILSLAYKPEEGYKTQVLFWRRRPTWSQVVPWPEGEPLPPHLSARLWISNFTFRSLVEPDRFDYYNFHVRP